jgi:hypothetical protein
MKALKTLALSAVASAALLVAAPKASAQVHVRGGFRAPHGPSISFNVGAPYYGGYGYYPSYYDDYYYAPRPRVVYYSRPYYRPYYRRHYVRRYSRPYYYNSYHRPYYRGW